MNHAKILLALMGLFASAAHSALKPTDGAHNSLRQQDRSNLQNHA